MGVYEGILGNAQMPSVGDRKMVVRFFAKKKTGRKVSYGRKERSWVWFETCCVLGNYSVRKRQEKAYFNVSEKLDTFTANLRFT